jgi:DNA polymerase
VATKQQKLDDIAKKIIDDKICPELASQATQLVFGDGNADSQIVFIGEAPGKNEDLQGKPFVGAAGKFLNEMLEGIGLKREDIYITNIVKYRPPDNRDPHPEEKKAFLPYLQAQLEVIQPKIVATLGRHSMNCFLPDLQISQIHGQPKRIKIAFSKHYLEEQTGRQEVSGVQGSGEKRTAAVQTSTAKGASQPVTPQSRGPQKELAFSGVKSTAKSGQTIGSASGQDGLVLVILPLFHPAAALYNGGMRQTLIDDFARIPDIINAIKK